MLVMVAAGPGVAILPEWVSRLAQTENVFSPLGQIPAVVDLALAWVAEAPPRHMQGFIEVAESFSRK